MSIQNEIDKLKRVKVPLRAVWLGRWRAWRRRVAAKKEVRLIGTLSFWVNNSRRGITPLWMNLFENGGGKRWFKFHNNGIYFEYTEFVDYHKWVLPWIHHEVSNKDMKQICKQSEKMPSEDAFK